MAYVGKTGRRIAYRFRKHLIEIHNEATKPVSIHFSSPDHSGEGNVSITSLKSCSNICITMCLPLGALYEFDSDNVAVEDREI